MSEQVIPIVREVVKDDGLNDLVRGLFRRIGLTVRDTGERCVVAQTDAGLEVLDAGEVDYEVEIEAYRVERLRREVEGGAMSEVERFRVIGVLFTAATRATLRQRRLASPVLRRLSGAEPLIHVCMTSPDPAQEPDACHTLIHAAGQWLVIEGLHGRPRRSFRMSLDQTLDYQRRAADLMAGETLGKWVAFARWYRGWRKLVSVKGPMPAPSGRSDA